MGSNIGLSSDTPAPSRSQNTKKYQEEPSRESWQERWEGREQGSGAEMRIPAF